MLNTYRVIQVDEGCPFYESAVVEHLRLNRYEVLYLISDAVAAKPEICSGLISQFKQFGSITADCLPEFISYGEINGIPFFTRRYLKGTPATEIFKPEDKPEIDKLLIFFAELISNLIYLSRFRLSWNRISLSDIKINNGKILLVHLNFSYGMVDYKSQLDEEQISWLERSTGIFIQRGDTNVKKNLSSLAEFLYENIMRKNLTTALNNYNRTKDERAKLKKKQRDQLSPMRLNQNLPENIESLILKATHHKSEGGYEKLEEMLEDILKIISGEAPSQFIFAERPKDTQSNNASIGAPDLKNPFTISSFSKAADSPATAYPERFRKKAPADYSKIKKIIAIIAIVIVVAIIGALGFKLVTPLLEKANQTPSAKASASIYECETGKEVILDGSQSSDPDKNQLDYFWKVLSPANGQALFSKNNSHEAEKIKVIFLTNGEYKIELKVYDGKIYSQPEILTIKVK